MRTLARVGCRVGQREWTIASADFLAPTTRWPEKLVTVRSPATQKVEAFLTVVVIELTLMATVRGLVKVSTRGNVVPGKSPPTRPVIENLAVIGRLAAPGAFAVPGADSP